jgi:hypothetical protein
MAHVLVVGFCAVLLFVFQPEPVFAAKAECDDPIDAIARIGYPGRLPLSITEDEDEKECRFSVAGVAAGSPPAEQLEAAILNLRNVQPLFRSAADLFGNAPVLNSVPLLLAAASPRDRADPRLVNDDFQQGVADCFVLASEKFLPADYQNTSAFGTDQDVKSSVANFGVTCATATPGAVEQLNAFLGGSVRLYDLEVPVLVFKNERGDGLTEYLFIPVLQN